MEYIEPDFRNKESIAYNLAKASYGSVRHHENLINAGYKLQTSNDRNRIYVGPNNVLLGYRGTDPKSYGDLKSDLSIVSNRYQDDPNFKDAENFYQMATTFGKPVLISGHSLGGTKAIHVAKKYDVKDSYAFNPGTGFTKLDPGKTNIFKSSGDIISGRIGRGYRSMGYGHSLDNFEGLKKYG